MNEAKIWDLWTKEWENAYRFFKSKGNLKTKSQHKDRWYKEFREMLKPANREG